MTEYEAIQVEREGRVQIIRFNRPDKLNAFNPTMSREFVEAVYAANDDSGIGAIVSTGNGRAYSSGSELGRARGSGDDAPAPSHGPFDAEFIVNSKPIIGAINGVAVGMGFTGPLHFDALVASTEARFSARFAAIGLTPEMQSSWLLPHIIGLHRAKEMMLTGRIYSAQEALELGLVHRLVEPDRLIPEAVALAEEIAANPESTLRVIKRMLWEDLLETDFTETSRRSSENFSAAGRTVEAREAVRAFMEKRERKFHDAEHMANLAEEPEASTS